jgi:hypothetical protein
MQRVYSVLRVIVASWQDRPYPDVFIIGAEVSAYFSFVRFFVGS